MTAQAQEYRKATPQRTAPKQRRSQPRSSPPPKRIRSAPRAQHQEGILEQGCVCVLRAADESDRDGAIAHRVDQLFQERVQQLQAAQQSLLAASNAAAPLSHLAAPLPHLAAPLPHLATPVEPFMPFASHDYSVTVPQQSQPHGVLAAPWLGVQVEGVRGDLNRMEQRREFDSLHHRLESIQGSLGATRQFY